MKSFSASPKCPKKQRIRGKSLMQTGFRPFKSYLCNCGADKLIDKRAAEYNGSYLRSVMRHNRLRDYRKTDCNTRLRNQRRTYVLCNGIGCFHNLCTYKRAEIFTHAPDNNVNRTHNADLRQHGNIKPRTRYDKEQLK